MFGTAGFLRGAGTHVFRRCALARKIAKQSSLFLGTAPATPKDRQRRQAYYLHKQGTTRTDGLPARHVRASVPALAESEKMRSSLVGTVVDRRDLEVRADVALVENAHDTEYGTR